MDKAQILNRVYASSLPTRARTVMFYLVNRSNKELTCFPAIPTIARETGLCERTVQRALKELCEQGFIEKSPRYRENRGQSSNLYVIILKEDDGVEDAEVSAESSQGTECEKTIQAKVSEVTNCYTGIELIDFSAFKDADLHSCHQVGDNCVPP